MDESVERRPDPSSGFVGAAALEEPPPPVLLILDTLFGDGAGLSTSRLLLLFPGDDWDDLEPSVLRSLSLSPAKSGIGCRCRCCAWWVSRFERELGDEDKAPLFILPPRAAWSCFGLPLLFPGIAIAMGDLSLEIEFARLEGLDREVGLAAPVGTGEGEGLGGPPPGPGLARFVAGVILSSMALISEGIGMLYMMQTDFQSTTET